MLPSLPGGYLGVLCGPAGAALQSSVQTWSPDGGSSLDSRAFLEPPSQNPGIRDLAAASPR
jgi:hypothetical protein